MHTVYPNHAANKLTISNGQFANKVVTVIISDARGKVKKQQGVTPIDGKLKLDVSSLVTRIYFYDWRKSVRCVM